MMSFFTGRARIKKAAMLPSVEAGVVPLSVRIIVATPMAAECKAVHGLCTISSNEIRQVSLNSVNAAGRGVSNQTRFSKTSHELQLKGILRLFPAAHCNQSTNNLQQMDRIAPHVMEFSCVQFTNSKSTSLILPHQTNSKSTSLILPQPSRQDRYEACSVHHRLMNRASRESQRALG